mgnify:CR=1 FL=1
MTLPHYLLSEFEAIRSATMALAEPLSDEDCCAQSMPEASPIKWHLAHTTWFFETFVLERFEVKFRPFHASFRVLFNSYYNGIGNQYPRARRGLITRPSLAEVEDYRSDVDARISALLLIAAAAPTEQTQELEALIILGMQHEQQHQELMLTDIKHLLWNNPLRPAYTPTPPPALLELDVPTLQWCPMDAGIVQIGHTGDNFHFDNELPRHRQFVESFELASRLVTNGEYMKFMQAGAYQESSLWLSEGWDWLHGTSGSITHPLYWEQQDGQWQEFTLHGLRPLEPLHAAMHLSFFEADAYARWAGARLPSEAEWESAVAAQAAQAHAAPLPNTPALLQLFDTAWQWTSSSYAPYPGFNAQEGATGEYNGKFMVNQYVLRGASCATPPDHSRISYRNFFPSNARWQFTAIRLARSV